MSTELTWSDFLRQPTCIEPLLKKGSVLLRRRDAQPLRICRADAEEATGAALAAAARLLSGAWDEKPRPALDVRVEERLPWTRFLPDADRHEFAVALLKQFEACADLGDFSALGRLFAEWRKTASLYAEGRADALKRPVESVGQPVRRPKR